MTTATTRRAAVHISNGAETSVKITLRGSAAGFEVDAADTIGGRTSHRHLGVYPSRALAIEAARTEAARITKALFAGTAPA